jgi:hypothetical protein
MGMRTSAVFPATTCGSAPIGGCPSGAPNGTASNARPTGLSMTHLSIIDASCLRLDLYEL